MEKAVEYLNQGMERLVNKPKQYLYSLALLSNSGNISQERLLELVAYFDQNAKNRVSLFEVLKLKDRIDQMRAVNQDRAIQLIEKHPVLKKWKGEISKKVGYNLHSKTAEFADLAEIIFVMIQLMMQFTTEDFSTYSAINKIMKRLDQPDLKKAINYIMDEILVPNIQPQLKSREELTLYDERRTLSAKSMAEFLLKEYYLGSSRFDMEDMKIPNQPRQIHEAVQEYNNSWNQLFSTKNIIKNKELFTAMKPVFEKR